ncbi:MAG: response regulator [Burkholderiales bacterium]
MRILIVEDDVDLGQTVAQSLAEEGYAIEIASDGHAALEALRREVPDLVLLDLMMANMNGWEFRERQLADPLWARIPVVVLTAVSDLVSATIQASEVLKKPVSLVDVLSTIRRHAGGGRETEA